MSTVSNFESSSALRVGRRHARAGARGMTLVELIIVITIIGVMTAAIAIGVMGAVQTVNYVILGRYAWALYFLSLGLIIYTLLGRFVPVPGVRPINGAFCWIVFPGGVSFEPSELMKISYILVLARFLRFRDNYRTMSGLLGPFLLTLLPAVFILKQPDLGVADNDMPQADLRVARAQPDRLLGRSRREARHPFRSPCRRWRRPGLRRCRRGGPPSRRSRDRSRRRAPPLSGRATG